MQALPSTRPVKQNAQGQVPHLVLMPSNLSIVDLDPFLALIFLSCVSVLGSDLTDLGLLS